MKENKYYTPNIEDIRIGYECEVLVSPTINSVDWSPLSKIIDKEDLNRVLIVYDRNNLSVRTSYLTKEEIEAEGWKLVSIEGWIDCLHKKSVLSNCSYYLWLESNELEIRKDFIDLESTVYKGKCPSINEFRYICKLLGI